MVYNHNEYRWRHGSHYPVKAQAAGEFLNEMSEHEGGLTSKRVLDVSRAEDALLHPCFEWDDGIAAEAYREGQATKLIGNLVTVHVEKTETDDTPKTVHIRAFADTRDRTQGTGSLFQKGLYKPLQVAIKDEADRTAILANAKRDAIAFCDKYEMLTEFAHAVSELRAVVKTI